MSKATVTVLCDDAFPPRRVRVLDDGGGETTYLRAEETTHPDGYTEFKYDQFHPNLVELGTRDGEILLQQDGRDFRTVS